MYFNLYSYMCQPCAKFYILMSRVNNFGRNTVTYCDTQKSHHKINEKL